MYNYGKHAQVVGVTGIESCMGVFVRHGNMLYAIHIPDHGGKAAGGQAFAQYVQQQDGTVINSAAQLIGVINRTHRTGSPQDEVRAIAVTLVLPRFTMIRLISTPTKNNQSTAVICQPMPGKPDTIIKAMPHDSVPYTAVGAVARDGYYSMDIGIAPRTANTAVSAGWTLVEHANSSIAVVNV
jgi:hypothetical protein